ncbi:hypothetical protein predicted by Glimmer/Critica [Acetobacter ghanensis]|uniref:Uncharacterized protein n=1 Tax=Acetobacter ghanensis TaxID=431306 RepID=A0A0U5F5S7_9PROT|nr:hypothetical protein predicted by Glimmer/Critica [Acetobacter ghanensis]
MIRSLIEAIILTPSDKGLQIDRTTFPSARFPPTRDSDHKNPPSKGGFIVSFHLEFMVAGDRI